MNRDLTDAAVTLHDQRSRCLKSGRHEQKTPVAGLDDIVALAEACLLPHRPGGGQVATKARSGRKRREALVPPDETSALKRFDLYPITFARAPVLRSMKRAPLDNSHFDTRCRKIRCERAVERHDASTCTIILRGENEKSHCAWPMHRNVDLH